MKQGGVAILDIDTLGDIEEDERDEDDCADPDAGIPDLCRMCDHR
jgi:hypothetical protein